MLSKTDFLYDKRLVERFIKRGDISREDYRAHIRALPDVTEKSEPIGGAERRESGEHSGDR